MSDAQASYIVALLDRRVVSGRTAHRIIQILEECPEANASGLENLDERLSADNT